MRMRFIRTIALTTLACFITSFVLPDILHAAAFVRQESEKPPVATGESIVPSTAGRVTGWKNFGSAQVAVIIQDLHCHAEVQKNISDILSALDTRFALDRVYVEGASGPVDTSWLSGIADEALRTDIVEGMLSQGRLTGSEYFSVRVRKPNLLSGIENEALYRENLLRLSSIMERRTAYERSLRRYHGQLAELQERCFSDRNRRFDKAVRAWRAGTCEAPKYYRLLLKYADDLSRGRAASGNIASIDPANYATISLFLKLNDDGKRINHQAASHQLRQFVAVLRNRLPYDTYQSLLDKTANFSKIDELYDALPGIVREHRLTISSDYPALAAFFEYLENARRINPVTLISEEKHLVEQIRAGLSADITELEVSLLTDLSSYAEDYLLNRLSSEDYVWFRDRIDSFERLKNKYLTADALSILSEDRPMLSGFYEANLTRNQCFMENITALRSVNAGTNPSENFPLQTSANGKVIAIVAGGFHTEGITELLAARGISYVTVMPQVTGETREADALYRETARVQARILSATLAPVFASVMASIARNPGHAGRTQALCTVLEYMVSAVGARAADQKSFERQLKKMSTSVDCLAGMEITADATGRDTWRVAASQGDRKIIFELSGGIITTVSASGEPAEHRGMILQHTSPKLIDILTAAIPAAAHSAITGLELAPAMLSEMADPFNRLLAAYAAILSASGAEDRGLIDELEKFSTNQTTSGGLKLYDLNDGKPHVNPGYISYLSDMLQKATVRSVTLPDHPFLKSLFVAFPWMQVYISRSIPKNNQKIIRNSLLVVVGFICISVIKYGLGIYVDNRWELLQPQIQWVKFAGYDDPEMIIKLPPVFRGMKYATFAQFGHYNNFTPHIRKMLEVAVEKLGEKNFERIFGIVGFDAMDRFGESGREEFITALQNYNPEHIAHISSLIEIAGKQDLTVALWKYYDEDKEFDFNSIFNTLKVDWSSDIIPLRHYFELTDREFKESFVQNPYDWDMVCNKFNAQRITAASNEFHAFFPGVSKKDIKELFLKNPVVFYEICDSLLDMTNQQRDTFERNMRMLQQSFNDDTLAKFFQKTSPIWLRLFVDDYQEIEYKSDAFKAIAEDLGDVNVRALFIDEQSAFEELMMDDQQKLKTFVGKIKGRLGDDYSRDILSANVIAMLLIAGTEWKWNHFIDLHHDVKKNYPYLIDYSSIHQFNMMDRYLKTFEKSPENADALFSMTERQQQQNLAVALLSSLNLSRHLYYQKTGKEFLSESDFNACIGKVMMLSRYKDDYGNANAEYDFGKEYLMATGKTRTAIVSTYIHEMGHNLTELQRIDKSLGELLADLDCFAQFEAMGLVDKISELKTELSYEEYARYKIHVPKVGEEHASGRAQLEWIEQAIKEKTKQPINWIALWVVGMEICKENPDLAFGDFTVQLVSRYCNVKSDVDIPDDELVTPDRLRQILYDAVGVALHSPGRAISVALEGSQRLILSYSNDIGVGSSGALFGKDIWRAVVEAFLSTHGQEEGLGQALVKCVSTTGFVSLPYELAIKAMQALGWVEERDDYYKEYALEIARQLKILGIDDGNTQIHIVDGFHMSIPGWSTEQKENFDREFVAFTTDPQTGKTYIFIHKSYLKTQNSLLPDDPENCKARLMLAIAHEYIENKLIEQGITVEEAHKIVLEMGFTPEILSSGKSGQEIVSQILLNWQKAIGIVDNSTTDVHEQIAQFQFGIGRVVREQIKLLIRDQQRVARFIGTHENVTKNLCNDITGVMITYGFDTKNVALEQGIKRIYNQFLKKYMNETGANIHELMLNNDPQKFCAAVISLCNKPVYESVRNVDSEKKLKFVKIAGYGSDGVAILVKDDSDEQLKVLKVPCKEYDNAGNLIDNNTIQSEIKVLQGLIGVEGVVQLDINSVKRCGSKGILMPYIEGTTLDKRVSRSVSVLTNTFFKQLFSAGAAIAEKGYCMADFGNGNIIMTNDLKPIIIDVANYRSVDRKTGKLSNEKFIKDFQRNIIWNYLSTVTLLPDNVMPKLVDDIISVMLLDDTTTIAAAVGDVLMRGRRKPSDIPATANVHGARGTENVKKSLNEVADESMKAPKVRRNSMVPWQISLVATVLVLNAVCNPFNVVMPEIITVPFKVSAFCSVVAAISVWMIKALGNRAGPGWSDLFSMLQIPAVQDPTVSFISVESRTLHVNPSVYHFIQYYPVISSLMLFPSSIMLHEMLHLLGIRGERREATTYLVQFGVVFTGAMGGMLLLPLIGLGGAWTTAILGAGIAIVSVTVALMGFYHFMVSRQEGMQYSLYDIPEGYRDIMVVLDVRGPGFGNISGVETLATGLALQFPKANIMVSALVKSEEYAILEKRLRRNKITLTPWNEKRNVKTDVVIFYGMYDPYDEDYSDLHIQAKLYFRVPIYFAGKSLAVHNGKEKRFDGVKHILLPTAQVKNENANLIFDRTLTAESKRIEALTYDQVIYERKALVRQLSVIPPSTIDDIDYDAAFAFAYVQSFGVLTSYLFQMQKCMQASGRKAVVFIVPGSLIMNDLSSHSLSQFKDKNVNVVLLQNGFEFRSLYNRLLLFTGSFIVDEHGEKNLRGAFPNIITGNSSLSEAMAARKVFVHDGFDAHEGGGFVLLEKMLGATAALKHFKDKYHPQHSFDLAALFRADPRQLHDEYVAAIDPFLDNNNIVDSIGKIILKKAGVTNVIRQFSIALRKLSELHVPVFEELDRRIAQEGLFAVTPEDRQQYIALLMQSDTNRESARGISDACKKQLKAAQQRSGGSFAHCSAVVVADMLEKKREGSILIPPVREMAIIKNAPRVLLITPFAYRNNELRIGSFLAPSLGIYRIANYLRLFGIAADIYDPNLQTDDELDEMLKNNTYSFVGSSTYELTLEKDTAIAEKIHRAHPGAVMIVGGEGAYDNRESLLSGAAPFDLLIKGFGEFPFLDLVLRHTGRGNAMAISGIVCKSERGSLIDSNALPVTKPEYQAISSSFDTSLVPYERYWDFMAGLYPDGKGVDMTAIKTVRLFTSSHCPMKCTFCSQTNFLDDASGQKQPVLSMSDVEVLEQLDDLVRFHPDVKALFFNDDDFMFDRRRVISICDAIISKYPGRFKMIALGRVDKVDAEMLGKMKQAGFFQISYGVENFSDKVLKDMNKHLTAEQIRAGLDLTAASGIQPHINLLPFYPTADLNDIEVTFKSAIDYVKKGSSLAYWSFTAAFKGSVLAKNREFEVGPGKIVEPRDPHVRALAHAAVDGKDAVAQEIKTRFGMNRDARLPSVVHVLSFIKSFNLQAKWETAEVDDLINEKMREAGFSRHTLQNNGINDEMEHLRGGDQEHDSLAGVSGTYPAIVPSSETDSDEHPFMQAFGVGVENLMTTLVTWNPLLAQFLLRPSIKRAGDIVTSGVALKADKADELYADILSVLRRQINEEVRSCGLWTVGHDMKIELVTLTSPELVQDKDSCVLATMSIAAEAGLFGQIANSVVFVGHQWFWAQVQAHGPPAGYSLEQYIRLLVQHEINEYIALRPEVSRDPRIREKYPWIDSFDAYLAANNLKRNSTAFHLFIENLSPADMVRDEWQQLAAQSVLLKTAHWFFWSPQFDELSKRQDLVYIKQGMRASDKIKCEPLFDTFIEYGMPAGQAQDFANRIARMGTGKIELARLFGTFNDEVRDALISGDPEGLRRISAVAKRDLCERLSALADEYDRQLTVKQKDAMMRHLIPLEAVDFLMYKFGISRSTALTTLNNHPDYPRWIPQAKNIVSVIKEPMQSETRAWQFVFQYGLEAERRVQEVLDIMEKSAAILGGVKVVWDKAMQSGVDGLRKYVAQKHRQGKAASGKKARNSSEVWNNRTGALEYHFSSLKTDQLAAMDDHTIRKFPTNAAGMINVAHAYVGRMRQYPHAEVDLMVKNGKIVKVVYVKDKDGRPIEGVEFMPTLKDSITASELSLNYREAEKKLISGEYEQSLEAIKVSMEQGRPAVQPAPGAVDHSVRLRHMCDTLATLMAIDPARERMELAALWKKQLRTKTWLALCETGLSGHIDGDQQNDAAMRAIDILIDVYQSDMRVTDVISLRKALTYDAQQDAVATIMDKVEYAGVDILDLPEPLPWNRLFAAYCAAHAAPQTTEAFHRYVSELAAPVREQEDIRGFLKRRNDLFAITGNTASTPRVVSMADYSHGMGIQELSSAESMIVVGYTVKDSGLINLTGRKWGTFTDHANTPAVLCVTHGLVARVAFLADGAMEDLTLIVDNRTGVTAECFHKKTSSMRLKGLNDITVRNFRLNQSGKLFWSGEEAPRAHFSKRPGEMIDFTMKDDHIRTVYFHSDKTQEPFAVVMDNRTHEIGDSFYGSFGAEKLAALEDSTIFDFTLPLSGQFTLGGQPQANFSKRGGELIDITVKNARITRVQFHRDASPIDFIIVRDNRTGKIINTYYKWPMSDELSKLDDVTISNVVLDRNGNLAMASNYFGSYSLYAGAHVELSIEQGKVVTVRFVHDRDGNPVLDVNNNMLCIDPRGNIMRQLFERSQAYQDKRLAKSLGIYTSAEQCVERGEYRAAVLLFARCIVNKSNRVVPIKKERLLVEKARLYIECCRKMLALDVLAAKHGSVTPVIEAQLDTCRHALLLLKSGRRLKAMELIDNVTVNAIVPVIKKELSVANFSARLSDADSCFDSGDYALAEKKYKSVLKRMLPDSAELAYVSGRIQDCRVSILYEKGIAELEDIHYEKALKIFQGLFPLINEDANLYISLKELMAQCQEQIDEKKSGIRSFSISKYYNTPLLLSAEEQKQLLNDVDVSKNDSQRHAAAARGILAEKYIWLVKKVAGSFASPKSDFYDELVSEGYIALYDLIDRYVAENNSALMPFAEYAENGITQCFDQIRKERNKPFYKELSLQKKLAGKNSGRQDDEMTLEAFIPSQEKSPEDTLLDFEDNELLQGVTRKLDAQGREIVRLAMEEGLVAEEIVGALGWDENETNIVRIKKVLMQALAGIRALELKGPGSGKSRRSGPSMLNAIDPWYLSIIAFTLIAGAAVVAINGIAPQQVLLSLWAAAALSGLATVSVWFIKALGSRAGPVSEGVSGKLGPFRKAVSDSSVNFMRVEGDTVRMNAGVYAFLVRHPVLAAILLYPSSIVLHEMLHLLGLQGKGAQGIITEILTYLGQFGVIIFGAVCGAKLGLAVGAGAILVSLAGAIAAILIVSGLLISIQSIRHAHPAQATSSKAINAVLASPLSNDPVESIQDDTFSRANTSLPPDGEKALRRLAALLFYNIGINQGWLFKMLWKEKFTAGTKGLARRANLIKIHDILKNDRAFAWNDSAATLMFKDISRDQEAFLVTAEPRSLAAMTHYYNILEQHIPEESFNWQEWLFLIVENGKAGLINASYLKLVAEIYGIDVQRYTIGHFPQELLGDIVDATGFDPDTVLFHAVAEVAQQSGNSEQALRAFAVEMGMEYDDMMAVCGMLSREEDSIEDFAADHAEIMEAARNIQGQVIHALVESARERKKHIIIAADPGSISSVHAAFGADEWFDAQKKKIRDALKIQPGMQGRLKYHMDLYSSLDGVKPERSVYAGSVFEVLGVQRTRQDEVRIKIRICKTVDRKVFGSPVRPGDEGWIRIDTNIDHSYPIELGKTDIPEDIVRMVALIDSLEAQEAAKKKQQEDARQEVARRAAEAERQERYDPRKMDAARSIRVGDEGFFRYYSHVHTEPVDDAEKKLVYVKTAFKILDIREVNKDEIWFKLRVSNITAADNRASAYCSENDEVWYKLDAYDGCSCCLQVVDPAMPVANDDNGSDALEKELLDHYSGDISGTNNITGRGAVLSAATVFVGSLAAFCGGLDVNSITGLAMLATAVVSTLPAVLVWVIKMLGQRSGPAAEGVSGKLGPFRKAVSDSSVDFMRVNGDTVRVNPAVYGFMYRHPVLAVLLLYPTGIILHEHIHLLGIEGSGVKGVFAEIATYGMQLGTIMAGAMIGITLAGSAGLPVIAIAGVGIAAGLVTASLTSAVLVLVQHVFKSEAQRIVWSIGAFAALGLGLRTSTGITSGNAFVVAVAIQSAQLAVMWRSIKANNIMTAMPKKVLYPLLGGAALTGICIGGGIAIAINITMPFIVVLLAFAGGVVSLNVIMGSLIVWKHAKDENTSLGGIVRDIFIHITPGKVLIAMTGLVLAATVLWVTLAFPGVFEGALSFNQSINHHGTWAIIVSGFATLALYYSGVEKPTKFDYAFMRHVLTVLGMGFFSVALGAGIATIVNHNTTLYENTCIIVNSTLALNLFLSSLIISLKYGHHVPDASPTYPEKFDRTETLALFGPLWEEMRSLARSDTVRDSYFAYKAGETDDIEVLPLHSRAWREADNLRIVQGGIDQDVYIGYKDMCLIHLRLLKRTDVQAELQTIWLHPAIRQNQIGTRLTLQVCRYLKSKGFSEIRIEPAIGATNYWMRFGIGSLFEGLTTSITIDELTERFERYLTKKGYAVEHIATADAAVSMGTLLRPLGMLFGLLGFSKTVAAGQSEKRQTIFVADNGSLSSVHTEAAYAAAGYDVVNIRQEPPVKSADYMAVDGISVRWHEGSLRVVAGSVSFGEACRRIAANRALLSRLSGSIIAQDMNAQPVVIASLADFRAMDRKPGEMYVVQGSRRDLRWNEVSSVIAMADDFAAADTPAVIRLLGDALRSKQREGSIKAREIIVGLDQRLVARMIDSAPDTFRELVGPHAGNIRLTGIDLATVDRAALGRTVALLRGMGFGVWLGGVTLPADPLAADALLSSVSALKLFDGVETDMKNYSRENGIRWLQQAGRAHGGLRINAVPAPSWRNAEEIAAAMPGTVRIAGTRSCRKIFIDRALDTIDSKKLAAECGAAEMVDITIGGEVINAAFISALASIFKSLIESPSTIYATALSTAGSEEDAQFCEDMSRTLGPVSPVPGDYSAVNTQGVVQLRELLLSREKGYEGRSSSLINACRAILADIPADEAGRKLQTEAVTALYKGGRSAILMNGMNINDEKMHERYAEILFAIDAAPADMKVAAGERLAALRAHQSAAIAPAKMKDVINGEELEAFVCAYLAAAAAPGSNYTYDEVMKTLKDAEHLARLYMDHRNPSTLVLDAYLIELLSSDRPSIKIRRNPANLLQTRFILTMLGAA